MNNYNIKVFSISLLLLLFHISGIQAQDLFTNPSLEDQPADATMPSGWFSGSRGTTPDILPGYWGVYLDAEDGDSYVGLITRPDGSFESIAQRLNSPLKVGSCYQMGLYLAHSDNYTGYNHPLKLRVYVANKKNKREQLIFESPLIDSEDWEFYRFEFTTESKAKYLILEAYNSNGKASKGNILIDGLSELKFCNRV